MPAAKPKNGDVAIVCEDGTSITTRVLIFVDNAWLPMRGVRSVSFNLKVDDVAHATVEIDMTQIRVQLDGKNVRIDAMVETANDAEALTDEDKRLAVEAMVDRSQAVSGLESL
jgi:hypothetical protein